MTGIVDHAGYLDHAATTPMRAEVLEAMLPWLGGGHGNPSGSHRLARLARRAVDDARDQVAAAVGCEPGEVVFTSGGTEADDLAVHGTLGRSAGPHIAVCSAIEHHAVLDPVVASGGRVVSVDERGLVDVEALAAALDPSVALVSVILANNEIGVVQPLEAIAAVVEAQAPQAVLHTDAVQALRWLDVGEAAAPAALISLSGHKIGGPTGVGALVVRAGTIVSPRLTGGGQERGRRSGSHNVAGIVGLGVAARLCADERKATVDHVEPLRDRLVDGLLATVADSWESGARAHKIAGNAHLCFAGVDAESLLFLLDQEGICASAASSCSSGAAEPSHVLAALGIPVERARGSLRLSLGPDTSDRDVDHALAAVPVAVARIRETGR